MKRKVLSTLIGFVAASFLLVIFSGFSFFQNKAWAVPDNYKNMKNPVPANADAIAEGKSLYTTHCKSCHGTKGLGDGNKAAQLKTEPGDFSTAEFQGQSDGALFYKTSEGRYDICNFKKKIPDADERWRGVHYKRTFKK